MSLAPAHSGQRLTQKLGRPRIRPNMDAVTLAAVISVRLEELGWTLERASCETGISTRHLRRIIGDERYRPQRGTVEKLSKLGIPRSTLLLSVYQQEIAAVPA